MAETSREPEATMSSDNKISDVVADFEMLTVTNYVPYNLRRRTSKKNPATEVLNRRCSLKPKKKIWSDPQHEIREYYVNKNISKRSKALATIFEESDDLTDNPKKVISGRNLKSAINSTVSESKLRKIRMKINKPLRSRINLERSLISFGLSNVRAEYVKKLNEIRNKVELLLQPINHPTDLPTNEVIQPIANQPMVVNQNG